MPDRLSDGKAGQHRHSGNGQERLRELQSFLQEVRYLEQHERRTTVNGRHAKHVASLELC